MKVIYSGCSSRRCESPMPIHMLFDRPKMPMIWQKGVKGPKPSSSFRGKSTGMIHERAQKYSATTLIRECGAWLRSQMDLGLPACTTAVSTKTIYIQIEGALPNQMQRQACPLSRTWKWLLPPHLPSSSTHSPPRASLPLLADWSALLPWESLTFSDGDIFAAFESQHCWWAGLAPPRAFGAALLHPAQAADNIYKCNISLKHNKDLLMPRRDRLFEARNTHDGTWFTVIMRLLTGYWNWCLKDGVVLVTGLAWNDMIVTMKQLLAFLQINLGHAYEPTVPSWQAGLCIQEIVRSLCSWHTSKMRAQLGIFKLLRAPPGTLGYMPRA